MTHELRTWPEYYQAIVTGEKTFEVRKNDRDFKVNDKLFLKEWCPEKKDLTGHFSSYHVTYVLQGGQFGIEDGYCVMGIKRYW